jgi:hypothetical protein
MFEMTSVKMVSVLVRRLTNDRVNTSLLAFERVHSIADKKKISR